MSAVQIFIGQTDTILIKDFQVSTIGKNADECPHQIDLINEVVRLIEGFDGTIHIYFINRPLIATGIKFCLCWRINQGSNTLIQVYLNR